MSFPLPENIPAGFVYFLTSRPGVHWYMKPHEDGLHADFWGYQDVESILDRNQAMANHNSGWSIEGRDKLLKRASSTPVSLIYQWKEHEGVDYYDPNDQKEVNRRLNSREFHKLRTAEGNL